MFSYEVMSEFDAMQERFQLLKEGDYDAVISGSIDTVSANSGNPMMSMIVSVYDDSGKPHDIKDFLVFTKSMMWKVVHFVNSAGLLNEYQEQKLCSEVAIGKRVRVHITVEEGGVIPDDKLKGKAPGAKYPNKNKIEDYIVKKEGSEDSLEDSDIPF